MSRFYVDMMVISLTLNWSILCFNLVPRVRTWLADTKKPRRFKLLIKVCKHYVDKPLVFSKIVTDQILIWTLVVLSFIAICASDVIWFPFRPEKPDSWHSHYIEAIFAMNIGRYMFVLANSILSKRHRQKVKYRADLLHHLVAVICYSFFLAYGENLLLGLTGVFIETTTIFDEMGREFRDSESIHTRWYRRLVIISCVFNVVIRGIVPTAFLVLSMFQQSPFKMNNLTLMVFFLSMIFFSVINVWQILISIQRLLKTTIEKSHETFQCSRDEGSIVMRGTGQFKFSKNNLGYLRPYNNKNIAYQNDSEKDNLNNKKDTAKESIKIHVDPKTYLTKQTNAGKSNKAEVTVQTLNSSGIPDRRESVFSFDSDAPLPSSPSCTCVHHHTLRISNGSSDSSGSDIRVLLRSELA